MKCTHLIWFSRICKSTSAGSAQSRTALKGFEQNGAIVSAWCWFWWTAGGGRRVPPCHLRLARLSPVQLRLLSPPITTLSSCSLPSIRSRTRAQSASLQPPGSVCKHRRFALLKRSYKANQPERNSRLLVVRLILTLVRFASLSVRTDLWGLWWPVCWLKKHNGLC